MFFCNGYKSTTSARLLEAQKYTYKRTCYTATLQKGRKFNLETIQVSSRKRTYGSVYRYSRRNVFQEDYTLYLKERKSLSEKEKNNLNRVKSFSKENSFPQTRLALSLSLKFEYMGKKTLLRLRESIPN